MTVIDAYTIVQSCLSVKCNLCAESSKAFTFTSEGNCTFWAAAIVDAAASEDVAKARLALVEALGAVVLNANPELEAAAVLPKPPKLGAELTGAAPLEAAQEISSQDPVVHFLSPQPISMVSRCDDKRRDMN